MKSRWLFLFIFAGMISIAAGLLAAGMASGSQIVTKPVYVPNTAHANGPLPDGVLEWNSLMLKTNIAADANQAHFLFTFTNVAREINKTLVTNVTTRTYAVTTTNLNSPRNKRISPVTRTATMTNVVWVTNSVTPVPVTILDVHPSCGCTTAQIPPRPWTIPARGTGEIPVTVNMEGKGGTFFKSIQVTTDKGSKQLLLEMSVMPQTLPAMTAAERARGVAAAKINRQAVFHGDCATCHVNRGQGKYGEALFVADCAICHEAEHRASFVPDLHNLKAPTNVDFWRIWIAHGKPGSLMPAFSTVDGGPLSDMQIASLASYLTEAIPSKHLPSSK
jgi:mono/diheme cytochrome c family protein